MGALIGLLFALGVLLLLGVFTQVSQRVPTGGEPNEVKVTSFAKYPNAGKHWRSSVLYSLMSALGAVIATNLLIMAVIAAAVGALIPHLLQVRRQNKSRATRRSAWPDVIDSLVSAVRAGMSLPESVCALAHRGPECLRAEFQAFAADYRATGRFEASLLRLRDELADPVADRIVEALLAARDVGGTDLGRMLKTLVDFLRQDLRLRGEVEARHTWTINGARLAVAAPWLVLLMLSTRSETVEAYRTTMGMTILVIAAATTAFAYWLMLRIGRLPDEGRIVR
jgi:tight adherence protein B